VYCGDALEKSAYITLTANQKVAAAITDPPFNVAIAGNVAGLGKHKHREFLMASGEMNQAQFIAFLNTVCSFLVGTSREGSLHYIFMDWRHIGELLAATRDLYGELKNLCVWVKDRGGMGSFYRSQHELVFVFKQGGERHRNNVQLGQFGRNRTNVWSYPSAASFSRNGDEGNLLALHPTVKPVAMIADAIMDCTARNEVVLDPFLGSGTTVIAAERTGRRCFGIEIDPLYVDVIVRRWQNFTRDDVTHAATGLTFNQMTKGREGQDVK
jgi:DNA modification methylase